MRPLIFGQASAKELVFPTRDGRHREKLLAMDIILAVGKDDPFLDNDRHLSHILWDKGVWHALHEWDGRAHRSRDWRKMTLLYV